MNAPNREHETIEGLLKQAKLPEPSAPLRDRVTGTAREAWNDMAAGVPWQVPLRRLALSAAAALILISAANYFSDRAIARALPDRPTIISEDTPDLNALLDIPGDAPSRHWVGAGHQPSSVDAQGMREYIETVRQMLDEARQHEPSDPLPSTEGRSQRFLGPFHFRPCC